MASFKDILEIANKRIDSGDIPDEKVIIDIDSLDALTNDLAADSLLKRYPFDFPMSGKVKPGEVPILSKILGYLDLEDDEEGLIDSSGEVAGRSALRKFLEDFPKKQKEWKKAVVEDPSLGERGWKTIKDVWKVATLDAMNSAIDEGRRKAIDGEGIERVGGLASKFFTPRRYEALVAGRDPSASDYIGDAIETGLMSVPATKYAKILGGIPKAGKLMSNRAVSNIIGNSMAPFFSEMMDAAIRGEDDPNKGRQDFSVGDVLMGAATNLGVNIGLARALGSGGRVATGELSRNSGGGIREKVRKFIEDFGKNRAERGLPAPTTRAGKILDAAEMAAPTLLVNRYGSDKDAKVGAGIFNMVGMTGVDPVKALEDFRDEEKASQKQERVGRQISRIIGDMEGLDERDKKYLDVISKNPDVVKFGFSEDPDDFKIWLLERGNRLIRGTEAYRPIWDVK